MSGSWRQGEPVPAYPDANLWTRLRRRSTPFDTGGGVLAVSRASQVLDLIGGQLVDKHGLKAIADDLFVSPGLASLLPGMLTVLSGPDHRRLRAHLDGYWADGSRLRLTQRCGDIVIRQTTDGANIATTPDRIVRGVVAELLGVGVRDVVVDTMLEFAPHLAQLNVRPTTELAVAVEPLALATLNGLRAMPAAPGSLSDFLTSHPQLTPEEAYGMLVFVVAAAAETLRTCMQLCIGWSASRDQTVSSAGILRTTPPAPFMFYSAAHDFEIGELTIQRGDLLALNIGSGCHDLQNSRLAFGHGAHYCFGARLTISLCDLMLRRLRGVPVFLPPQMVWDTNRLVRRLCPVSAG